MPDIDIIIKATDNASGKLKDVNRELGYMDGHSKGLPGPLGTLSSALGSGLVIAAGAALVAIGALGVGLKNSIGAAANMEQGVADISAIMGKSAPPVEELNALIQELGLDPKLKVSATQAAEAINMLARNGVSWDDIQGGMARNTILLANATNDDFALAADVATDAMVQFNKDGSEMGDVIDQIIGVTQSSKFDLNDYALALSQTGGVAGSVGVDFEDMNAMLTATSSSFSGGSDAGTSFKVFLQQLIPDTNKSADAMRELGLFSGLTGAEFDKLQGKISDTEQEIAALDPTSENYAEKLSKLNIKLSEQRAELNKGGSAFFDANGNMKSGSEIAGALATAFTGLSDAERISAASTIFGTDAMRTALALADQGAGTVAALKAEIGDTSAEDAAATRMDTLKGSWEIFRGVVETLQIQLGTVFLPILRDVVEWLTKMATEHGPAVIAWFTSVTTSATAFIDLLRAGNDPLTAFKEAFKDFIPPAVMSAIESVVSGIRSVITVIGEILSPFVTWNDLWTALALVLGTVVIAAIASFVAAIAPVAALLAGLVAGVALVRNAWEGDWGGIKTKTLEALDSIKNRFAPLVETIKTFGADALKEIGAFVTGNETKFTALGKIWDETKRTFGGFFTDLKNTAVTAGAPVLAWFDKTFPEASAALKKAFGEVSTKLSELWEVIKKTFATGSEGVNSTLKNLQQWWKEHGDTVMKTVDSFLTLVITIISTAIQTMTSMLKLFFQLITGDWKGAWETIKQIAELYKGLLTALWNGFVGIIKAIWTDFVEGLKLIWDTGLGAVLAKAKERWEEIKTAIKDRIEDILNNIKTKWDSIKTAIAERIGDILTNARDKWEEIKKAIKDRIEDILTNVKEKWEAIKKAVGDRVGDILTNMRDKWEAIKTAISDRVGNILDNTRDKWENIKTAISNKITDIVTNVTTKWEEIKTAIRNKMGDILTTATERWESIKTAIANKITDIVTNVTTKWESIKTAVANKITDIVTNVTTKWEEIKTAVSNKIADILTNITTKWEEIKTAVANKITDIVTNITTKWEEIKTAISNKLSDTLTNVKTKIGEIFTAMTEPFATIYEKFKGFGSGAAQGLIDGIGSLLQAAKDKAAELANAAAAAVGITLQEQSPSKVFFRHGEMAGQGFVDGMNAKLGVVAAKAKQLADIASANAATYLKLTGQVAPAGVDPAMAYYAQKQSTASAAAAQIAAANAASYQRLTGMAAPAGVDPATAYYAQKAGSTSTSTSKTTNFTVNVQSSGDAVRDIRNQVELYALMFGAT